MTRRVFPDDRTVIRPSRNNQPLRSAATATAQIYLDAAASLPANDLLWLDGTPIVGAETGIDAWSRFPLFQGPDDGTDTLYVVIDGGPASAIYARVDDRLDALSASVTALTGSTTSGLSAESAARAAADAAEISARTAADTAEITARAAAVAAEAATRAAADSQDVTDDAAEVAARAAADTAEATARAAADSAEAAARAALDAREAADNAARATAIGDETAARIAAVSAEASARSAADSALNGSIVGLSSTLTTQVGALNAADLLRVLKAGDTMSGDLAMGTHRVTGLADPAAAQDAATRAYVLAQITGLINAAPGALDTLGEIATQLASDESAAGALTTAVGLRGIVVNHGAVASTARPSSALPVAWYGTVAPANAVTNDTWDDQLNDLRKRWTGTAWVTNGSGTYVQPGPFIDLNVGHALAGISPVSPGADITTALQAAYDYIAANFTQGGRILLHVPGTYLLNGAPQTGTYTSGSSIYTWNGQILLPALSMANTKTITLEGVNAGSGDSNTGGPSGVIIQSNATAGYLFDCRPAFTRFAAGTGQNCCWTGVIPRFRDITFLAPDNPTCGGFNFFATQRAQFERTYLQTPTFNGTVGAGSLAGVVWPQVNNNGDLVFDHSFVRGFPVGMVLSEHLRARNSLISGCLSAFQCSGQGHANLLDIDIEECPTVFDGTAYAGVVGTPNTFAGTMVDAAVDFENVASGGSLVPSAGAFVKDTRTGPIRGQVRMWLEGNKTLPVIGGSELDVVPLSKAPTNGPIFRAGWMNTHPYDNMGRLTAISGAGAPGMCSATMHPWRTETGVFAVSAAGSLTATTGPAYGFVPTKAGGVSRIISITFQVATGGEVRVLGHSPVIAGGLASNAGLTAIMVRCVQGSGLILRANNTNIVGLDSVALVANTTYTVDLEIINGWQSAAAVLQAAYPVLARVYLNGTFVGQAAIPPALATLGASGPSVFPIYEDGLAIIDTASFVTFFRVRDANQDPRRQHIVVKTGARAAHHFETTVCTSGTFTVTLPSPVQDAPNVIVNTGSGTITVAPPSGTLTSLAGATGNLTLTQGQRAEILSPDGTNFQQVA